MKLEVTASENSQSLYALCVENALQSCALNIQRTASKKKI